MEGKIERWDKVTVEMVGNLFWLEDGRVVCAPLAEDGSWAEDEVIEPENGDPKVWAALKTFLEAAEADRKNW